MMKIKAGTLILFLFFSIFTNAQWKYRTIEKNWEYQNFNYPKDTFIVTNKSVQNTKDHTSYLQNLINKYDNIVLPDTLLLISDKGIVLRSNQNIYFQKNTILQLIPSSKSNYSIIKLHQVRNTKIFNPVIIGDRKSHLDSKGEWGMGIDIKSSSIIEIHNPYIKDCWGDGIYLGILSGKQTNSNILISKGVLDYNRRNGISITSGNLINIDNVYISNTYGVNPMAGIDIEPNKESIVVNNILIKNVNTFNSGKEGVLLYLSNLRFTKEKESNIEINNHIDKYSSTGFKIGPISYSKSFGSIKVSNSSWNRNKEYSVYLSDYSSTNLNVSFINSKLDGSQLKKTNFISNKKVKTINKNNVSIK